MSWEEREEAECPRCGATLLACHCDEEREDRAVRELRVALGPRLDGLSDAVMRNVVRQALAPPLDGEPTASEVDRAAEAIAEVEHGETHPGDDDNWHEAARCALTAANTPRP